MSLINLLKITICMILACSLSLFRGQLQDIQEHSKTQVEEIPLYLPKKEAVKLITLGYEHFAATLLWFSTLNYFGEKFLAKEAMPWFNHRCDLVTDLDPKARHVFEFCGTLLAWIAKEPENSNKILTKGITLDPNYWRYYYLRGFNNWYFINNYASAKSDFEIGSKIENAPSFLVSLASRLMVKEGEEDNAIAFLKASYVRTEDLNAKAAIAEKLNLAVVARDVKRLREAVINFEQKKGYKAKSLNDLKTEGIIDVIPVDPFDENYVYQQDPFKIFSNKGGEGLSFKGKTATGKIDELS